MSDPEVQILYKYRTLDSNNREHVERIFMQNEIYFPSPIEFNDPFDSRIQLTYHRATKQDWKPYLNQLLVRHEPGWNRAQRREQVQKFMKSEDFRQLAKSGIDIDYLREIGVFCMTEKRDHILMWSHYSKGHTGFCLEFQASPYTPMFGEALRVDYAEEYPDVNFFGSSPWDRTKAILLTKARAWKYEKEWRIVDHSNGPGIHKYDRTLLTGVILGCNMREEHREMITNWVRARNPRPVLYQSKIKEREFGLDIVRVELD